MTQIKNPASPIEMERISVLHLESLNEERDCYTPHCNHKAINSHVVQKKRSLSRIASNGKFIELRWPQGKLPIRFSPAGINKTDVLSFPGFCGNEGNDCDRSIFSPIEPTRPGENIDFSSYSNKILFCYRTAVCELHKLDSWISTYHKIISDNTFSKETRRFYRLVMLPEYKRRRIEGKRLKHILELELNPTKVSNRFIFHVERLPFIEVISSGVFGMPVPIEEDPNKQSTGAVFMHTIPEDSSTILLLGYDKGVETIENIPVSQLNKALSDTKKLAALIFTILIKRIETWGISESLYKDLNKFGIDQEILDLISFYLPRDKKSQPFFFDILGLLEDKKSLAATLEPGIDGKA